MAGAPLDNLEEFFDFSLLESDDNGYSTTTQYEHSIQALPTLGPDSAMDWQPSIPESAGAFNMSPQSPFNLSEGYVPNFDHVQSMPLLVPSIAVMPQSSPDGQSRAPSDSWKQHSVPREEDVITLKQARTSTHKPASAKRKGPSNRLPVEARQMLEEEFAANPYPCSWEMDIIAHQANLDVKRVRNWYNNTRARKKPQPSGSLLATLTIALLVSLINDRIIQRCHVTS